MRLFLVCSILGLVGAAGCTRTSEEHDAAPTRDMGLSVDVGHDAPATACTTAAQCQDGIVCTVDDCVVGNMCSHTPINAMCDVAAGEHCDPVRGCTTMTSTTCNMDADCDDHSYCNGMETCVLHTCINAPSGPACNDGDPCTTERCDDTVAGCVFTTICDAGTHPNDTGPVCTPFVAPTDFDGTFFIAPAQNQGCGVTSYSLSRIVLSVSGSTASASGLTIMGSPITLTGTVAGNTFDVSYAGCGTYHLAGTFGSCRESFDGHWSTMYGGGTGCGSCTSTSVNVSGLRSGT
jgi:hypothetical protein